MATDNFQSLQNIHESLLQKQLKVTDENREQFTKEVKDFIEQTKQAGSNISSTRERDQVRANLRYWANYVYSVEKIFPDTELAPSTQGKTENKFGMVIGVAITVIIAILAITFILPKSTMTLPASPTPSIENPMSLIEQYASQTAAATKTVAQAQGNQLSHLRVLSQFTHVCQRYVSRWRIQVKHAGQNQLQRTALGAHHHVDTRQVALKCPVNLALDQQYQCDGSQPQGQQQQIERCRQRPRPQVAKGQRQHRHAACSHAVARRTFASGRACCTRWS